MTLQFIPWFGYNIIQILPKNCLSADDLYVGEFDDQSCRAVKDYFYDFRVGGTYLNVPDLARCGPPRGQSW